MGGPASKAAPVPPRERWGAAIDAGGLQELRSADLSPWFNPFLAYFAGETLRCRGTVRVVRNGVHLTGLLLDDRIEGTRSVFTRSLASAQGAVSERGVRGIYTNLPCGFGAETFGVYGRTLDGEMTLPRFRHPVRPVTRDDLPEVAALLAEVTGSVDHRWLHGIDPEVERGFVALVGEHIAGVGWVSVLGPAARAHSLAVRIPYRRLGIGGDLLVARATWAARSGATRLLSEIADRNSGSIGGSVRAGLQRIGELYYYPPA